MHYLYIIIYAYIWIHTHTHIYMIYIYHGQLHNLLGLVQNGSVGPLVQKVEKRIPLLFIFLLHKDSFNANKRSSQIYEITEITQFIFCIWDMHCILFLPKWWKCAQTNSINFILLLDTGVFNQCFLLSAHWLIWNY